MGLEATASESVVDEKEEKHFHHAMGQKLHEVPFQATFRTLGSLRERKARPEKGRPNGEKSSEGCVNGVQHFTGRNWWAYGSNNVVTKTGRNLFAWTITCWWTK